MPGTVPLIEAAVAAVVARLAAQIPTATVERARRSAIVIDDEDLPRLLVRSEDATADDTVEPGRTHYTLGIAVTGIVRGVSDTAAEQAMHGLYAQVVEALAAWTPDDPGLSDLAERGAEFRLYEAEESAEPAGEFTAGFQLLAVATLGGPWSV